jgi:hypothetical protein
VDTDLLLQYIYRLFLVYCSYNECNLLLCILISVILHTVYPAALGQITWQIRGSIALGSTLPTFHSYRNVKSIICFILVLLNVPYVFQRYMMHYLKALCGYDLEM